MPSCTISSIFLLTCSSDLSFSTGHGFLAELHCTLTSFAKYTRSTLQFSSTALTPCSPGRSAAAKRNGTMSRQSKSSAETWAWALPGGCLLTSDACEDNGIKKESNNDSTVTIVAGFIL